MSTWVPFTERARHVIVLAQEAAQRLGHDHVGTEHILLGLVNDEESVAAKVLRSLKVDLAQIRADVEAALEQGDREATKKEMIFAPDAKRVIELAFSEARRLNHNYIGTEHLLLGSIRELGGIAGRFLAQTRYETVRSVVSSLPATKLEPSSSAVPHTIVQVDPTQGTTWEPFTERARRSVVLAQEEAHRLGNNYIATEHLLLGIISEGTSLAAKELDTLGASLSKARAQVEAIVGRVDQTGQLEVVFTPRAKRVIELAFEEARQLKHNYIGTDHLLLGLIREGGGIASQVLTNLRIDVGSLRQALSNGEERNS